MTTQPNLFNFRTNRARKDALAQLLAVLGQYYEWVPLRELRERLPWLNANRMSKLLEIDEGRISSTHHGYLLTEKLTPMQNDEAHRYLKSRVDKQLSRIVRRNNCWHAAGRPARTA